MTGIRLLTAGLTLVCAVSAQSPNTGSISSFSSFSAPLLGVVEAQGGASASPVLGVPGAARFGDPLSFAGSVTRVFVAPGCRFALVQQNSGEPLAVAALSTTPASIPLVPVSGAFVAADRIAFSPTGASAALFSSQVGEWQIITGLPSHPQAGSKFVLPGVSGPLMASTLSDDGQMFVVADQSSTVWSVMPGQSPVAVYHGTDISALAMLPNSRQTIVCDRAANLVVLLSVSQNVPPRTLLSAAQGLASPAFATVTADGSAILIASSSRPQLWSIDPASGAVESHTLTVQPTALNPLTRDSFVISAPGAANTWIVDWQRGQLKTFFVAQLKHLASAE